MCILGSSSTIDQLYQFDFINNIKISEEEKGIMDNTISQFLAGKSQEQLKKRLMEIVKKYDHQSEIFLLACTEISYLLKNEKIKSVDTMDIMLNCVIKRWQER